MSERGKRIPTPPPGRKIVLPESRVGLTPLTGILGIVVFVIFLITFLFLAARHA